MSKTLHPRRMACQALRQAIIEQALPPGTKLPEDELGAQFGMSRTLVRATLARLQAEGLVERRPKRTAPRSQADPEGGQGGVRAAACPRARGGAPGRSRVAAGVRRRAELHVREESAAQAAGDERVAIRLAGEFHVALAGMTGNGLLQRYLGELVSRCSLILATLRDRIRPIARSTNTARSSPPCAAQAEGRLP